MMNAVLEKEMSVHMRTPNPVIASAISLKNVTVEFTKETGEKQVVLNNVSLECRQGEFLALVGRSGCGKTTVLNLASGVVTPTSGEVRVFGSNPVTQRKNIGYMFARDCLMPWRTALENAELGLQILGVSKRERTAIARDMLKKVDLQAAENRYPWQLSQGMRQRVALARTWARDPSLLLMDEPFSALDVQTRGEVSAQFLNFWDSSRRSVIFVTHDLGEALLLADRVILLGGGEIKKELVVPFERPRDPLLLPLTDQFVAIERDLMKYLL